VSLAVLSVLRGGLNQSTIQRVLSSGHYYTDLQQEIDYNNKMITIPTGLPVEIVEEIFLLEEVQADVNAHLKKTFEGGEYEPDLEKIKRRIRDKVELYLEEKNITPDHEQSRSIDDYINMVAKEYSNRVKLPLLMYLSALNIDYQMFYLIATAVLIVVILIFMIILYYLNYRLRHVLYYAYNSAMAAAFLLAGFSIVLLKDRLYTELQIAPISLRKLMIDYITKNLHTLLSTSILFLLLSLVLLLAERAARSNDT
jgi:hypothetical protein